MRLLPALRARGYEFLVVASRDDPALPEEADYQGIPVHRFRFWDALAVPKATGVGELIRRIMAVKRAFEPDLLHLNFLGPSTLFHFATAAGGRMPMLVSLDSGLTEEGGSDTLLGRTLRAADWVTCVSRCRLAEARRLVPEIAPRSSVIYYAREVPSLLPTALPFAAPRVLCLGRLAPEKGFDLALGAFPSVLQRFPKARLLVAGDGPERAQLERQAAHLGLTAVVEFLGWVEPDAVPALINQATLVTMPSRREGLPAVALDAALMARPVVATRIGGLPEVVVHQETGVLVEPESPAALASALGHLLEHPETAVRLGQTARDRVLQVFGWPGYVQAYDTLYRTLLEEGGRR
jgi:glycogen(starch) synthase